MYLYFLHCVSIIITIIIIIIIVIVINNIFSQDNVYYVLMIVVVVSISFYGILVTSSKRGKGAHSGLKIRGAQPPPLPPPPPQPAPLLDPPLKVYIQVDVTFGLSNGFMNTLYLQHTKINNFN